ncbi:hypothetical protein [Limnobacter sp.]|uniref:hypothetical protein n=1 Tax=Limnobacter sp. TaxID=2003368 RepID=UPI003511A76D
MRHVVAPNDCLESIQNAWAEALREPHGQKRMALLGHLAETTEALAHQHPQDAKVHVWLGIVLSGYARQLGGLCALQLLERARQALETALNLNPKDGLAHLYLGLLYEKAPEAPFGFGDEKKAKLLLQKGLALTRSTQARAA